MEFLTGAEYLKIDIANQYGLDKELFSTRLNWVNDNLDTLESFTDMADEPALFTKACMTLRYAQKGEPSGHMVGLDATASCMQIMGALTGCYTTCLNTGLIDPNTRADVYTKTTSVMNEVLKDKGVQVDTPRAQVKEAQMPFLYGSRAKPKEIFGEDTLELDGFYEANEVVAPGACRLMDVLIDMWDYNKLVNKWTLPDNFKTHVRVMYDVKLKVEVDELDHATFTHMYQENMSTNDYSEMIGKPVKGEVSLNANIVQSIDAYIVREMGRRCNYDEDKLRLSLTKLQQVLTKHDYVPPAIINKDKCMSLVHIEDLDKTMKEFCLDDIFRLVTLIEDVLKFKSSPLLCIHDCFLSHPNHMNKVRYHYKELLAEIAESELLSNIISEVIGENIKYEKENYNLPELIRKSNYTLS